ncbi:MAG: hypothetical protein HYV32_03240 [Candidatus Kerfeldbacteria bacterium]|nr:hypothetical protein [Candidatus Kerfeldbacteria bacterium]
MALTPSNQQQTRQRIKRSMTKTLNEALGLLNTTTTSTPQQQAAARYARMLQQRTGNPSAAAQKAIQQLDRSYPDIASFGQRIAQTPTDISDAEAAQAADMTRLQHASIDDSSDNADDDSDKQTISPKPNTPAALRAERQKEGENVAVAQNPKLRGQSPAARVREIVDGFEQLKQWPGEDEDDNDDEEAEDELNEEDDDDDNEFNDADEQDEQDEEASAGAAEGSRQDTEDDTSPEKDDGADAKNSEEEGARQAELLRQRRQEQTEQGEDEDEEENNEETEDEEDASQEQQGQRGSGGGLEALLSRAAKLAPPGPWKVVLTLLARSPMLRGIVIGLIIIIIFGILMIGFIILLVMLFMTLSPALLLNFDTLKVLYSLFVSGSVL